VTGDRDAFQLITQRTHVLFTKRGVSETVEYDPVSLAEEYGVSPDQIPDLKGLTGDKSDNIPGVPGVGDKTAVKLLNEYKTLLNALAHAHEQKGKLRERLETYADQARMSLSLATIDRDAPVDIDWPKLRMPTLASARPLFERHGFTSLIARLDAIILDGGSRADAAEYGEAPRELSAARQTIYLSTPEELEAFVADPPDPPLALVFGAGAVRGSVSGATGIEPPLQEELTFADASRIWRAPLAVDLIAQGIRPDMAQDAILPLLRNPEGLILYDAKPYLSLIQARPGARAGGDARIAAYLIDALSKSSGLSDLMGEGERADAAALYDLNERQRASIADMGATRLYEEIELPLTGVLADMERVGFLIDPDELRDIGARLDEREASLRGDIFRRLNVAPFNLNSPKQLGKALFEDLGLPTGRKTKSGYSTDADTLESLADRYPVVAGILDWRHVVKLKGTYIDGLLSKLDSNSRVHSTFFQTAAVTGRISSNEPNLQNIPTRTAQGREIRRAFIARPGWTLVDADYSQIELRILAHLAEDPSMLGAFERGEDIHTRMAAEVNGVAVEQVTPEMRSAAKAVNFGIVYGQSDYGLARTIGVTRAEAGDMIARYFARYPSIKRYLDESVAQGKANGYARTLLGRRRPLPELASANRSIRMFGERAAMNTPVQGSAADIIKLAMVRVAKELTDMSARLILQVHDELIVECPIEEAEKVAAILREQMQGAAELRVPLLVDIGVGRTWYDCK
jgi:DNA polymerase-1